MSKQNSQISFVERIIILIIFMIIPLHFIIIKYLKAGLMWEKVNHFHIVSVCYSVIFLTIIIFQNILHRPYLALVFGCHQIRERTFQQAFKYLQICSRCSGMLIGVFIMMLLSKLNINQHWFLLGMIPITVDGLSQRYLNYNSTNIRRFFTGLLFGPCFIIFTTYYYLFTAKLIFKLVNIFL